MTPLELDIPTLERMREVASRLAAALAPGDVIALAGDLGAGKTEFVKGLAAGLGVPEKDVTSPTFTIVQTYPGGRIPLHHVDLYRLETPDELVNIGLDELFREDAVVAVEWFDRFPSASPRDRLEVRIAIVSETARRLAVTGPARLVAAFRS